MLANSSRLRGCRNDAREGNPRTQLFGKSLAFLILDPQARTIHESGADSGIGGLGSR